MTADIAIVDAHHIQKHMDARENGAKPLQLKSLTG
jgi:hypothetical protein